MVKTSLINDTSSSRAHVRMAVCFLREIVKFELIPVLLAFVSTDNMNISSYISTNDPILTGRDQTKDYIHM